MKLSAFFLITFAIYVAFHAIVEVAPIFHLSKLILPILILIMLHGTELRLMIAIDFIVFTIAFLQAIPFMDSYFTGTLLAVNMKNETMTIVLWIYGTVSLFGFRALNYVIAQRILKKKKIRERIGKMLP